MEYIHRKYHNYVSYHINYTKYTYVTSVPADKDSNCPLLTIPVLNFA